MRQYSGCGTAEESNARYKFLLESGQTGLSVALDLPTQCGYDPVDPIAGPEIGKVGVSLSNLSEMELLFDGIDLGGISTSFTINGTAAIIYAMYVACADKQGEIGRASCRESVCQYVEISVVAVSLKTTNYARRLHNHTQLT